MSEATLQRIERKLDKQAKPKKQWVKVGVVTKATGWDHEKMRQARENNYIDYKRENGFWYDLNSLLPHFIKQTA